MFAGGTVIAATSDPIMVNNTLVQSLSSGVWPVVKWAAPYTEECSRSGGRSPTDRINKLFLSESSKTKHVEGGVPFRQLLAADPGDTFPSYSTPPRSHEGERPFLPTAVDCPEDKYVVPVDAAFYSPETKGCESSYDIILAGQKLLVTSPMEKLVTPDVFKEAGEETKAVVGKKDLLSGLETKRRRFSTSACRGSPIFAFPNQPLQSTANNRTLGLANNVTK